MDNLPSPQQTIRLSSLQNLDLHVHVRLPARATLLQLSRQENMRRLGRYSRQTMNPTKTLPRPPSVTGLLFQFPFRARYRAPPCVHAPRRQFMAPHLTPPAPA